MNEEFALCLSDTALTFCCRSVRSQIAPKLLLSSHFPFHPFTFVLTAFPILCMETF